MVDPDVESRWYQALFEEDCLRVMALLKEYPSLLKEGWEGDSSRLVEGSRVKYWMPRTEREWFGRTALHVGARRGCKELLDQIIELCYVSKMDPRASDLDTELSSTSSDEFAGDSPKEQFPTESERPETKRDPKFNAGSDSEDTLVGEGSDQEFWQGCIQPEPANIGSKLEKARSRRKVEYTEPGKDLLLDSSKRETEDDNKLGSAGPAAVSNWKSEADDRKLRRRRRSIARAGSKREVDNVRKLKSARSVIRTDLQPDHVDGGNVEEDVSTGVSVSLDDLLLVKDGEYKLDTLAIAVLNGNLEVLTVLLQASVDCEAVARRYDIRSPGLPESLDEKLKRKKEDDDRERNRKEQLDQLRKVTQEVIARFSRDHYFLATCVKGYEKHRDFNFLPREEYLFHFLFVDFTLIPDEVGCTGSNYSRGKRERVLRRVASDMRDRLVEVSPTLWSFLCELQDGQGRPPLHVAVDEGTVTRCSRSVFDSMGGEGLEKTATRRDILTRMLNTCDGGGRTAVHRLIALGVRDSDPSAGIKSYSIPNFRSAARQLLLAVDYKENDMACKLLGEVLPTALDVLTSRTNISFSIGASSKANGFKGFELLTNTGSSADADAYQGWSTHRVAPIHSAIIHKTFFIISILFDVTPSSMDRLLRTPLHCQSSRPGLIIHYEFDCLELATLVANGTVVQIILAFMQGRQSKPFAQDFVYDSKLGGLVKWRNAWPALHLAAGVGKYDILKSLVDDDHGDPFMEDLDGNTPLHHATKGWPPIEFDNHLLDYVNCQQILDSEQERKKDINERSSRKILNWSYHTGQFDSSSLRQRNEYIVEREGCINLLVQHGCDIFKVNRCKEAPEPGSRMDASFLSWWYEKQAREFASTQNTFGVVANAISVTAALVATASYVGPLQPPLGYGMDSQNHEIGLQLKSRWVKIFTVCDTMSFYLAIAAILCSFIPSLPMPQQSMLIELRRTRRMLAIAVAMLFPSIIFVLVAFASSSIAVIQANAESWDHGGLTITLTTACIGGSICLATIFLFFIRFTGFIFYKYPWVRKTYNVLSF